LLTILSKKYHQKSIIAHTKTNNEELSGKLAHTQTSCYGPHNVGRKHNDAKNYLQETG